MEQNKHQDDPNGQILANKPNKHDFAFKEYEADFTEDMNENPNFQPITYLEINTHIRDIDVIPL